jgi:hypothetical protein
MTQRVLRVVFTLLALLMGVAGTQGLNRTNANAGLCNDCGCPGGSVQCCTQGTITCYTGGGKGGDEIELDQR